MNNNRTEILLVEDNPDEAILVLRQLRGSEKDILHVKDGVEALDFIFGTGTHMGRDVTAVPGIILLDMNMPRVGGLEVLEKLRADNRTKNIPVVVLVSTDDSPDIKKSFDLGANNYIVKPVTYESFTEVIENLGMR